MGNAHGQFDLAQALAANFGLGDFDAAAIANHPPVADAFVFAAMAVPVLDRAKDALAEQPIAFWLEGAVVETLGRKRRRGPSVVWEDVWVWL